MGDPTQEEVFSHRMHFNTYANQTLYMELSRTNPGYLLQFGQASLGMIELMREQPQLIAMDGEAGDEVYTYCRLADRHEGGQRSAGSGQGEDGTP